MRIAVISKADVHGGGASRVAVDLTRLLNAAGHTAHHFAAWRGDPPESFSRELYPKGCRRLFRYLHMASMLAGFPEILPLEYPFLKMALASYDVVHFHDISSAISPFTVSMIARAKPTAWTVHDCSPFTGGCLYPQDCERYRTGCGSCPRLGEWPIKSVLDGTSTMRRIKGGIGKKGLVTYVTPSRWMVEMGKKSGITAKAFHRIPNGVDTALFRPRNKTKLRKQLGLPPDLPLVLLSAGSIHDERKGAAYAVAALRQLKGVAFSLLLLGNINHDARRLIADFNAHTPGYVPASVDLARYYACADVFLCCSLADNFPLVVLETMSCGVPTVGFRTGGIPDMVEHETNGYLVKQKDTSGLVAGLRRALVNGQAVNWGRHARMRARQEFSLARFLERHLDFYQHLLA